MIDRDYNVRDMRELLGRGSQIAPPDCYTPEYVAWFKSGLRVCDRHPVPFQWHLARWVRCPKCHPPAEPKPNRRQRKREARGTSPRPSP